MPNYIRVPLALEVLLLVIEQVFPATRIWLPIGGSHCIQLGILLALGVVLHELTAAIFGDRSAT